jgi:hypothetical protein
MGRDTTGARRRDQILLTEFASKSERVARPSARRKCSPPNHPHIGGIHGLEDAGGARFLVLEAVEVNRRSEAEGTRVPDWD